jgi:hypothetical protein
MAHLCAIRDAAITAERFQIFPPMPGDRLQKTNGIVLLAGLLWKSGSNWIDPLG